MTTYNYNITDFPNHKIDVDRLTSEIRNSAITIALDHIDSDNSSASIIFKSDISSGEKTVLDNIVAAHSGNPLPENVIQQVKIAVEQPKYIEEGNVTQELFCAESLIIDISSGDTTKVVDFSWPFHIALKSGTIYASDEMIGDEMSVKIAPDTIIGVITSSIAVGDTSVNVSPTVIQNIKYGQYAGLPHLGKELGRVITVGTDYLEFESPFDVSANAGSYIGMCAKIIPYLYFNNTRSIEIGKTVTTANRIPKNTIVRVEYKNNNGLAKKLSFFVEYLY